MAMFTQDEIKNIVQEVIQGEVERVKKQMKSELKDDSSSLYFDTETTGLDKNDVPVTLGLFQKGKGKSNYFLDYGNIEKNVENLFKAMTLPDKSGGFTDSAKELADIFGINIKDLNTSKQKRKQQTENAIRAEIKKKLQNTDFVKNTLNMIDREQVLSLLKQGQTLKGYNANFDKEMISRYFKSFKSNNGKRSTNDSNLQRQLTRIFNTKGVQDIRQTKVLSNLSSLGGINQVQFLKNTKLQNFIKLLTGKVDEHAHDASYDAEATYLLENNQAVDEILQYIAKVVTTLANKKGIKMTQTDDKGREGYTTKFTSLYEAVLDEMTVQLNDIPANNSSTSSSTSKSGQKTKTPEKVKKAAKSKAREAVGKLYRSFGDGSGQQTAAQKALTGKHLLDRVSRYGIDASGVTPARFGSDISKDSTPLAEESVAYYLEEIINAAEAKNMGVMLSAKGNNIQMKLYNKDDMDELGNISEDKMAKIEIGLVDENGLITIGNQSKVDLLTPIVHFYEDSEGNKKGQGMLSTAMERQLANIKRTIENSDTFNKRVEKGDIEGIQSLLKFVRNKAIENAPAGADNNLLQELDLSGGSKNKQEMVGMLSDYSIMPLAESLYRSKRFQELVNEAYLELAGGNEKRARKVNPNELTRQEIEAINIAFSYLANGIMDSNDYRIQSMEDNDIRKKILGNRETFNLIKSDLMPLIKNGFLPEMSSIKEEAAISGRGRFSGAQDIDMGNIFVDPSNRAQNQIYNRLEKANRSIYSRPYRFTSKTGRRSGIDYTDKQVFGQYTGAFVTDKEVYDALAEIGATSEQMVSVLEGGIILPASMAKELAVYRPENEEIDSDNIRAIQALIDSGILGADFDLNKVAVGTKFNVNQTPLGGDLDLGSTTVGANDIISAVERTANGLKLVVSRYEEAKEGTKALTGVGGRKTMRFISDDTYLQMIKVLSKNKNIDMSNVSWLTEQSSLSSKNLMESFRGRISYIIDEYLGKSFDEEKIKKVWDVLSKLPVIGKAFKQVGDQFELTVDYDQGKEEFVYEDRDTGDIKPLFEEYDENGNLKNIEELIKQAFIEGSDSAIEQLGKGLLGDDKYESTKGLIDASLNTARNTPYFTPTGGGNADLVEKKEGVRFTRRERDAFNNAMNKYGYALDNKEGMELYSRAEKEAQSRFGKKGREAQAQLQSLVDAVNNKNVTGTPIELVWGNATKPNQIDISEIADRFKYGENGTGVSEEDFVNTIGYIIKDFREKNKQYADSDIIMNLESALFDNDNLTLTNAKYKQFRLADIGYTQAKDGSYMPSITDTALTSLVRSIRDAVIDGTNADLSDYAERLMEDYKKAIENKNSAIREKAESTYMTHATHAKAVGQNTAWTEAMAKQVGNKAYNTLYVGSDYFRQLFSTQKGGSNEDYSTNIRNLSRLIRTGKVSDDTLRANLEKYENLAELQNKQVSELKSIEQELVNLLIQQVKQGDIDIVSQFHRYPSTSGMDVRHSYLGINDNLADGTIAVGRGTSLEVNADYDGDTVQAIMALMGSNFDSYDEFKKAYSASRDIAKLESEISKEMFEWEQAQSNLNDAASEREKQENNLVKEISKRYEVEFGAIMSKYNKDYVGKFSNISTNIRRSSQLAGFGHDMNTTAGRETAILSSLISAFTESLEQDAISAKKVMARLINNDSADAALNELNILENALKSGDIESAVQGAIDLGILKVDDNGMINSRQFKLAQLTALKTTPEEAKRLGIDSGISVSHLMTSIKALKQFAENNGIDIKSIIWNNEELIDKARRNASKNSLKNKKVSGPQLATGNAPKSSAQPIKANVKYEAFLAESSEGEHGYNLNTPKGNRMSDYSITNILGMGDPELAPWEKEKLIRSSAPGTYMHKIAELLVKNNAENVYDLSEEEQNKIIEARDKLRKEYGSISDAIVDELNKRAEETVKVAREAGIVNANTRSEVSLGGYLEDVGFIGGQADLISYDNKGKAIMGDWKFSKKGGVGDTETIQERIAQMSAYRAMLIKELERKLIEEQNNLKNATTEEDKQKSQTEIDKLEQQIQDFSQEIYGKIIRNYIDKNGEVVNEIMTARLIDPDKIMDFLRDTVINQSKDYKDLIDYSEITFENTKTGKTSSVNQDIMFRANNQGKVLSAYITQYSKLKKEMLELENIQNRIAELENDKTEAGKTSLRQAQEELKAQQKIVDTIQQGLPSLNRTSEGTLVGVNLLDEEFTSKLDQRINEIDSAYEKKSLDKINKLLNSSIKGLSQSFDLNTGLFGIDSNAFLKNLTEMEGKTKEMDNSMSSLTTKQRIYSNSLEKERSILIKMAEHQGKLNKYQEQRNKLQNTEESGSDGILQDLDLKIKKEEQSLNLLKQQKQQVEELRKSTKLDDYIDSGVYGQETAQWRRDQYDKIVDSTNIDINAAYQKGVNSADLTNLTNANKLIKEYVNNKKQQYKIEQQITSLELKMENQTGNQRQASEALVQSYRQTLDMLQNQIPLYNAKEHTLNGIELSEQQVVAFEKQLLVLQQQQENSLKKINASQKDRRNILQEIVGGFKQAFSNMFDASIAYEIIGQIRMGISQVIQTVKEMDAALVDLQIASGGTRDEMHSMMLDLNDLATEVGKTTTEVAQGANDWLRAGYEGQEAADLTRASMQLSTLGMIDSAEATSYLISVLKGWKLEAEDVSNVVDKLVAVDMAAATSAGDLAEAMSRAKFIGSL